VDGILGRHLGVLSALRQCEDGVLPLADFFCTSCSEEFELKSQKGKFGAKVLDGEFKTKCERLAASNKPNLDRWRAGTSRRVEEEVAGSG
jgi:hypothetical protein